MRVRNVGAVRGEGRSDQLRFVLDVTRRLYDAGFQERRDAYRMRGDPVMCKMPYAEFTALGKSSSRPDSVWQRSIGKSKMPHARRCERGAGGPGSSAVGAHE